MKDTTTNLPENTGAAAGNVANENLEAKSLSHAEEKSFKEEIPEDGGDDGDGEHLDELHDEQAFSALSKTDLISKFELALTETDFDSSRNLIKKITEVFEARIHDEIETGQNEFVLEGKTVEEYKHNYSSEDIQFEKLNRKYNKIRTEHRKKKEEQFNDNYHEKKKVIEELRELFVDEKNIRASFDKLHELQTRWRAVGFVARQYNEDLWKNYRFHIDRFYDLLKINKDLQELDQKKNLEIKIELCERAEDLLIENNINKALKELRVIQDKWRSSGHVAKEQSEVLWQRFKGVSDKIYERRKEHITLLDSKQNDNLTVKNELCTRMEKLLENLPNTHKKWQALFTSVDGLMDEWKKTGFASRKDNDKIWDRFRKLRKTFYEHRDAFYEEQRKEYAHNLKLKTDLCIQAEALLESTDWKNSAEQYKKLQEQWKSIGTVSPKHSTKIWNRFRASCNQFFENRKGHYAGRDKEMQENMVKKDAFIKLIENYEIGSDSAVTVEDVKKFQSDWLTIGMVLYDHKDRVSSAYYFALNRIMKHIKAENPQNKDLHLISQDNIRGSSHARDDHRQEKSKLQDKINRLQKDVSLLENNIEFFGKSKNADKIKEEFISKIDQAREEIEQLKSELKTLNTVEAS